MVRMGRREPPGGGYGLPARGGEALALERVTPDGAVPAWLTTSLARAEEAGLATRRAVVGDFGRGTGHTPTKGAAIAARVTGRQRGLGHRVRLDAPLLE